MAAKKPERSEWWESEPEKVGTIVHVEDKPTWTGLYDAAGRKLTREPEPFGFAPRKS